MWFVLNGLLRLIGEEGTYFLLSSLERSNYGSTVAHLTTFLSAWKCHAAGNGGRWLSSSVPSPAPYKNSGSARTTMVSLWYRYGNASYSCSSPPFVLPQSEPELSKAPPLGHLQSCVIQEAVELQVTAWSHWLKLFHIVYAPAVLPSLRDGLERRGGQKLPG